MKKHLAALWLACLLVVGFCFQAKAEPSGRAVNCLVITNTYHFNATSPEPLRSIMGNFGGVNYTLKYDLSKLTLEEVQKYDVVWVYNFAEWGLSSERRYGEIKPKDLSDILGNYVEQGGAMLECMYLTYTTPSNTLGLREGKYIEGGYSPFESTSIMTAAPVNMGIVAHPEHPIMKNVRAVSTDVNTLNNVPSKGASVLASWYETDAVLAAVKGKVVALNLAPIDLNVINPTLGVGCYIYADAFRLIDNSIKWLFSQAWDLGGPDTVSSFSIVSVPNSDKYDLSLTWKNPTRTIGGENLSKIDSICIYRDQVKIKTIKEALTIGAASSYSDVAVAQGEHAYKIEVYTAGKKGYPSFSNSYSGRDVPEAVSHLILAPKGNDALITWSAPSLGKRGGYVDFSTLKYKIVRLPDGIEVAKDITNTTYTDATLSGDPKEYAYVVIPYTGDGAGVSDTSYPFVLRTNGDIWMGTSNIVTCGAKFYDFAGPGKEISNNGRAYALILQPEHPEIGEKVQVSFSEFNIKGAKLEIYDGEGNENPAIHGSPFEASSLPSQLSKVTASAANKSGALTFYYYPEKENVKGSGWVAQIGCTTLKDTNLTVAKIAGDILPSVGKENTYTIKVVNEGLKPISEFQVGLCVGSDRQISQVKTLDTTLTPGASLFVEIAYTPSAEGAILLAGMVRLNPADPKPQYSRPYALTVQPQNTHYYTLSGGDLSTMFGPVCFFYKTTVSDNIYYPQELGVGKGNIKAIRYYNKFDREILNQPIRIYMGETTKTDLSGGFVDEELVEVFNSVVSFPFDSNEITILLNTPYAYKGKNLVIRVERPFASTNEPATLGETFYIYWDDNHNRQVSYRSNEAAFDPGNTEDIHINNYLPWTSFVIDCTTAGHLSGTVTDQKGQPMKGVKVTLKNKPYTMYTNAQGQYTFPGLDAAAYKVIFEMFDYTDATADVNVTLGQTTTQNMQMQNLPKLKVGGKVVDNAGDGVADALVRLSGYANISTRTNATGNFTLEGVYTERTFTIEASKDLFTSYTAPFISGLKDTVLANLTVTQWTIPALGVRASAGNEDTEAQIKWTRPAELDFNRVVYDDGSCETGFGVVNGKEGWFGSFFSMKDSGYLCSVDIYGYRNTYIAEGQPSERTLTLDIFDANRKLLYSSQPFYMPAEAWTTVEFPYAAYKDAFYAMVHFTDAPGYTHHIGCDETGPYAAAELNYYSDGAVWGVVQTFSMGVTPFAFMMRANVLESPTSQVKTVTPAGLAYEKANPVLPKTASLSYDFASVAQQERGDVSIPCESLSKVPAAKSYAPKYNIYRYMKTDRDNPSKWTLLTGTAVSDNYYSDKTFGAISQGVCGFAVKALYGTLESAYTYSNYVFRNMYTDISLTFTNNTPNLDLEKINVELSCMNCEEEQKYVGQTDAEGKLVINNVWKGKYKVIVSKSRYASFDTTMLFSENASYSANLLIKEDLRPAYNIEIQKKEDNTYDMSWNKSVDILDGFESHADFDTNSPGKYGWRYRDVNKAPSYGITGAEFTNMGVPCAYFVFNPLKTNPAMSTPEAIPYKGKKYLSSFSSPMAPNDKWLISPRLSYSNPFTFSFYAKTFDAMAGLERFQVCYSSSGTEIEDFKLISPGQYVSAGITWGQHTYTIPSDARYVAIRNVSDDQYMFMLDEVFIGNEQIEGVSNIIGYKVYLDGKFVADTKESKYTFTQIKDAARHKAGIVVLYASGESKVEEIEFGGASNDPTEGLQKIKMYPNPATETLYVEGAQEVQKVEILSLSGVVLNTYKVQSEQIRIPLTSCTSGVYFLKIYGSNGSIVKKFVKK